LYFKRLAFRAQRVAIEGVRFEQMRLVVQSERPESINQWQLARPERDTVVVLSDQPLSLGVEGGVATIPLIPLMGSL